MCFLLVEIFGPSSKRGSKNIDPKESKEHKQSTNQRESTDGCLNCEGLPNDGFSQLYVGGIEIIFENVVARQSSHEHEDEDCVADDEEPISTFPSPFMLQEVDQIQRE